MKNYTLLSQSLDKAQQGFTLIELMISLVLGMLISAAVMQVFLTSYRVDRIQTAGSEIQDKSVFGLQSIEPQIRLANLGNDGVGAINDTTTLGGIVLTASDDDDDAVNVVTDDTLETGYLTRSHDMGSEGGNAIWNGSLSNTDVYSDQLTIQYVNITGRTLYDCEGKKIDPDERVITRYFITDSGDTVSGDRKNLNLNCEAGRIKNNVIEDFGGSGQTIIQNIDQFNIRLGVQKPDDTSGITKYADISVEDYMDIDIEKPYITNIRIAILARSTANSPDDSADSFYIFGKEQKLKTQTDAPKYLRRVYESNILLRNARIMRVIDSSASTS